MTFPCGVHIPAEGSAGLSEIADKCASDGASERTPVIGGECELPRVGVGNLDGCGEFHEVQIPRPARKGFPLRVVGARVPGGAVKDNVFRRERHFAFGIVFDQPGQPQSAFFHAFEFGSDKVDGFIAALIDPWTVEIEDHIHFFLPDQFHDVRGFTVNRIVPVIAGVIVRTPVFALIAVHDSIPVRKRNRKDFERFAELRLRERKQFRHRSCALPK